MKKNNSVQRSFILGNPRSGTSLFRIMMNSHPRIVSPPESGFLQWWYEKYNGWTVKDNQVKLEAFVKDLLSSKKIEEWDMDEKEITDFIKKQKPSNYAELMDCIYIFYAKKQGKQVQVIADKNNYYIHHLDGLLEIWPDSKFVLVVRDGRDVACSYMALKDLDTESPYRPDLPSEVAEIAQEWKQNNTEIKKFLKKNEKKNSSIVVRYEDFILSPREELKRVCDFSQIEFSDKMLEYYLYNDEPDSTMDWKKKTKKPLDKKNVGKYKKILSKEEVKIFNRIAGDTLKEFGY